MLNTSIDMKKNALFVLILITLFGCKNDCSDYACFTPPPVFNFELLDKSTGENLFSNGTLNPDEILAFDEENKRVNVRFISENNINLINLSEIGWYLGAHTYKLIVAPDLEINIELDMEKKNENCCTYFDVLNFQVLNYEFSTSNTTEIITVLIP
ncbi:hypothetical protein Lupro_07850 [Lutibacter profundi]|uniref:Uncharacterized protein n=1 Tax=Lutibacter profundi TaxID=1622118 RepID=A0A109RPJ6_9FLAO|nr:hypothetical protein [Lutibacter profundi]AMC11171.1 hypothetical protein Lupro_07850 [Lutibacter profundi]